MKIEIISLLFNKLKEIDKTYNDYLNLLDESKTVYTEDYIKYKLNELRSQRWLLEDIIKEINEILESKGE